MVDGPFMKYLKLMIQLHEFGIESVESDVVRDQMDEPWEAMSVDQKLLCSEVSAALIKERDA
jgi:hypothetical protein